ncbi:MAG TPA: hypothetical protein GX717_04950 [Clostridiaceae bacterium]|nr:hypothetical protein [Clostridiaceae bacterium]
MTLLSDIRMSIPPEVYNSVNSFLETHRWPCAGYDLDKETQLFRENLRYGLAHRNTNMHMFPSFIEVKSEIPVNETAIVIDAGGTNLRIATVYFDSDFKPIIADFEQHLMPGLDGPVDDETFYDILAGYVAPLLKKSRKVGFCFSFATHMMPNKDGLPKPFSKELQLNSIVNLPIGQSLREALIRSGALNPDDQFRIVILNDSVAALLGGLQQIKQENLVVSDCIGYILGTGTNTAYIEENANISKLIDYKKTGKMVMNTESGTYPMQNRSQFDLDLDAKTQLPNDHLFEKMFSGRYKGDLLNEILSRATSETKLFSEAFATALEDCREVTTIAMSEFIEAPETAGILADLCAVPSDRQALLMIVHAIEDRAAQLACCNIAGVLTHLQPAQDHPVALVIDGSTYFKSPTFKKYLDKYFLSYIKRVLGYELTIIPSVNSNLIGATVAILTN